MSFTRLLSMTRLEAKQTLLDCVLATECDKCHQKMVLTLKFLAMLARLQHGAFVTCSRCQELLIVYDELNLQVPDGRGTREEGEYNDDR